MSTADAQDQRAATSKARKSPPRGPENGTSTTAAIIVDQRDHISSIDANETLKALAIPRRFAKRGASIELVLRYIAQHALAVYNNDTKITADDLLALRSTKPYCIELQANPQLWLQLNEISLPSGSAIIFNNISHHKFAAGNLTEQEALLRVILDAIPVNISVKDKEARVIYVNQHALQMMGAKIDDLRGKTQYEIFPNDYGLRTYNDEISVLRTGKPTVYQEATAPAWSPPAASATPAQQRPPLEFIYRKLPLRGADGSVDKCLSICIDITERKRAAADLAQLLQQLTEAQKAESIATLSSGIAHDLNNILAIIQSSAEISTSLILQGSPASPHLDQILQNTRRGARLVRQILDYARPVQRPTTVMSLASMIGELSPLIHAAIGSRNRLEIDVPDTYLCAVDRDRLLQVFLNLASNAAQAMPDGGVLSIRAFDADESRMPITRNWRPSDIGRRFVCIEVADTGSGISSDIIDRIFDPYFTSKPKTNRSGTGLGLPIARSIVHNHGGAMQVRSRPGQGTVFEILLPISEDQPEERPDPESHHVAYGTGQEVIVIDDEPILANSLAMLLELHGFTACMFTDATAAFETIQAQPTRFSVILADVNMPHMTGIDLANALAKNNVKVPIILITGQFIEQPSGSLPGVVTCLTKPVDAANLTKAVLMGIAHANAGNVARPH